MRSSSKHPSGNIAFRRRTASLAIASLLAAAGAAQAFEIDTGNPDIAMRWDNTVRYNLGRARAGAGPGDPRRTRTSTTATATSATARSSPTALDVPVGIRPRLAAQVRRPRERRPLVRRGLQQPRQHEHRDRQHAGQRPAGGRAVEPVHQALRARARRASGSTPSPSRNFDIVDVPVNVKAGQHTVYWGDSLLLGGAVHGVSYAQNSLDLWKGFATPGAEAKELFRPRGGLTMQAQPTKDLSIAGQWFYNWQAVRVPESGSYLTINDGLQFGGDSAIVAANPFAASIPGAPAYLARSGTRARYRRRATAAASATGASPRAGARTGSTARWASTTATRPTSCRSNPDARPRDRRAGGDLHGDRRHRRGARRLHRQHEGDHAVADLHEVRQVRDLRSRLRRQHPHLRSLAVEGASAGVSRRCGVVVPPEHAAHQRPGQVLPAPLVNPAAGQIATTALPSNGTPGALGDTYPWPRQRAERLPQDAAVRHRVASGRAHVDALADGHAERGGVQGQRQLRQPDGSTPIDKVTKNFVGLAHQLHADLVPGLSGRGPARRRSHGARGCPATPPCCSAATRAPATTRSGVAADIYQKYQVST